MGTVLEAAEGKLRSVAVEVSLKQLFSFYFMKNRGDPSNHGKFKVGKHSGSSLFFSFNSERIIILHTVL